MRWLIVRIGAISAVFVVLLVAARWIGSFQKNPAVEILGLDATEVARSCWHKICPGITTFAEAEKLLRAETDRISNVHYTVPTEFIAPWTVLCWDDALMPGVSNCATQRDTKLDTIEFVESDNNTTSFPVDLGDVVSLLGIPTESELCLGFWPEKNISSLVRGGTYFRHGNVAFSTFSPENLFAWRIDPTQKISSFAISTWSLALGPKSNWRGFATNFGDRSHC